MSNEGPKKSGAGNNSLAEQLRALKNDIKTVPEDVPEDGAVLSDKEAQERLIRYLESDLESEKNSSGEGSDKKEDDIFNSAIFKQRKYNEALGENIRFAASDSDLKEYFGPAPASDDDLRKHLFPGKMVEPKTDEEKTDSNKEEKGKAKKKFTKGNDKKDNEATELIGDRIIGRQFGEGKEERNQKSYDKEIAKAIGEEYFDNNGGDFASRSDAPGDDFLETK